MEMGVISPFKRIYRKNPLFQIIRTIQTWEKRKMSNPQKLGGMKGMDESYELHVLDAARLSHLSWNQVNKETIARCRIKKRILPEQSNS